MPTRLQKLRETLSNRKADLQRSYNFRFESIKLKLFNIETQIISANHPYFQYTNSGQYKGLITEAAKPNEINITFLEDTKQTINSVINIWDGLKYNIETGIHYPRAVYEDIAWLTYLSPIPGDTQAKRYVLTGFYPINRDSVSLSYEDNNVTAISVTFNVDYINMLFIPFI